MFIVENKELAGPKYIINFPTKRHWKGNSKIEDIDSGLKSLASEVELILGALQDASEFLRGEKDAMDRVETVSKVMEGFEKAIERLSGSNLIVLHYGHAKDSYLPLSINHTQA
jgi:hypothetical protein